MSHHTTLAVYRNLQGRLYRSAEVIDCVATALRLYDAAEPQVKSLDGTIYILIDGHWENLASVHQVLSGAEQTLAKLLNLLKADLSLES
ncbi:MAG: hypothetical protein OXC98_10895 [bacterium]|nr:hypothetical protein [Acidimicrobiia bacterium]MCY4650855.1 hypothetical protein [bacterium]